MDSGELRQRPRSLTTEIIEAIADSEGVEATELPPLYEHIDLDALEQLYDRGDGVRVTFTYSDSSVHVREDETVTVEPTGETPD